MGRLLLVGGLAGGLAGVNGRDDRCGAAGGIALGVYPGGPERSRYLWNLTKREFRRLLRLGLGRAILYAREHSIDRFEDEILDAWLKDDVYDHQVEEGRENYLLEVTDLHPRRKRVYDAVVAGLAADENLWSQVAALAKRKHPKALRALYDNFKATPEAGNYTALDLVEADGLRGFRFAVRKLGRLRSDYFLGEARDVLGASVVDEEMKWLGSSYAAEENVGSPREDDLPESYRQLRPLLETISPGRLPGWGRNANARELRLAARGLTAAKTPDLLLAHLRIFLRARFPLPVAGLLRLLPVKGKKLEKTMQRVLCQCKHRSLRGYALELLGSRERVRYFAVEMLLNNSRTGDLEVACRFFEAERSRRLRHVFGQDIVDFCEAHPEAPGVVEALLSVYERSPCTMCRRVCVEVLLGQSALPERLRAECAFDCNPRIRELVAAP